MSQTRQSSLLLSSRTDVGSCVPEPAESPDEGRASGCQQLGFLRPLPHRECEQASVLVETTLTLVPCLNDCGPYGQCVLLRRHSYLYAGCSCKAGEAWAHGPWDTSSCFQVYVFKSSLHPGWGLNSGPGIKPCVLHQLSLLGALPLGLAGQGWGAHLHSARAREGLCRARADASSLFLPPFFLSPLPPLCPRH